MKVLIVEPEAIVRDAFSLALEGLLEGEVVTVANKADATLALGTQEFDVVVSDANLSDGTAADIKRMLAETKTTSKFITYGSTPLEKLPEWAGLRPDAYLGAPIDILALTNEIKKLTGQEESKDTFCKVKLATLLLSGNLYHFDLHVKLSEKKYLKVLSKGDHFTAEDYAKYSSKQLKYLYLKRDDFITFVTSFTESIRNIIKTKSESMTADTAVNLSQSIHETLHNAIPALGMTPELEEMTKMSVNLAVTTIQKNPDLSKLLAKLLENPESYISWHSTVLTYVACWLSTLVGWASESTHYKLALAAHMHDITLEDDAMSEVQMERELYMTQFTEHERRVILEHPMVAAEMAGKMKESPADVDFIISQHHERPDGSGFPKKLSHTKIAALPSLFIIAHHMVSHMHQKGASFDIREFLETTRPMYVRGHFVKIFKQLDLYVKKHAK